MHHGSDHVMAGILQLSAGEHTNINNRAAAES